MSTTDRDLVRRAMAAHHRAGGDTIPGAESAVVEHDGLRYVVLRRGPEVLRVMRVMNRGVLRTMRRPPKALLS